MRYLLFAVSRDIALLISFPVFAKRRCSYHATGYNHARGRLGRQAFCCVDAALSLIWPTELIGEEIYDEFDPQGHPDLKSYAQNEKSAAAPTLKPKYSAPELTSSTATAYATPVPRELTKSPAPSSLLKPIPLPALKGLNFRNLGFARSKSAPPSPREDLRPLEKDDSLPAVVPEGRIPVDTLFDDDEKTTTYDSRKDDSAPIASPGLYRARDDPAIYRRSTDLQQPPVAKVRIANTPIRAPVPVAATTPFSVWPAMMLPMAASRSASPAPSLEQAILAERMRRVVSGSSTPAPKGARFKSSPLTGDRTGVVVAERVKQRYTQSDNGHERGQNVAEMDGRIPNFERDRDGPDID